MALKPISFFLTIAIAALSARMAHSQTCDSQWLPGHAAPGAAGGVAATCMWDPDGPGPQGARLVVAGSFAAIGNQSFNKIAMFDPVTRTWSGFGTGIGSSPFGDYGVNQLVVLKNGTLIAAGGFYTNGDGEWIGGVAAWDGNHWKSVGGGIDSNQIYALHVMPNGDLIAGGYFTRAGATNVQSLARWNGSQWLPVGSGDIDGVVYALESSPGGDVYIGGSFSSIGSVHASNIAKWNGLTWSALGSGLDRAVQALTRTAVGEIVAAGIFDSSGTTPIREIARWNGTTWIPMEMTPLSGGIYALASLNGDDLLAGGLTLTSENKWATTVARWNTTGWTILSQGTGREAEGLPVAFTKLPSGDIVVGGGFSVMGGIPATNLAVLGASGWAALVAGDGFNGGVTALITRRNGDIVAGGDFSSIGSVAAQHVASWNGTTWNPLGAGLNGSVSELRELPNGNIVAAGSFTSSDGTALNHVARWDGSKWNPMGPGLDWVSQLRVRASGELLACGNVGTTYPFTNIVARWTGTGWSQIGAAFDGGLYTVVELPSGDLVAGGYFSSVGGIPAKCVARWNGSSWAPMGAGFDDGWVADLAVRSDGMLIAGGSFFHSNGVLVKNLATWNDGSWVRVSPTPDNGAYAQGVYTLLAGPNRTIYAGGYFFDAGGKFVNNIARWDDSGWTALGSGVDGSAQALTLAHNGRLAVGGYFATAGKRISPFFAWFDPSVNCNCPCVADFDLSGGTPDTTDISAFFTAWLLGDAHADTDCSGGTPDSTDINVFFTQWLVGGC